MREADEMLPDNNNKERENLLIGDALVRLKEVPDNSVDSCVTDPPYELGFMGKSWDSSGIANSVALWGEVFRVLKPGGHVVSAGGTRTYHRMACAIEDAGFEIRDSIHWTYGTGFPKSHNVSKAIDKAAGAERQVIGHHDVGPDMRGGNYENAEGRMIADITAPATDAAKQWEGWGTALKPSHEPFVLARKPIAQTVAANVLEHGTGALNIDACRVGSEGGCVNAGPTGRPDESVNALGHGLNGSMSAPVQGLGRWPANTILTHSPDCDTTCSASCPVNQLDDSSRFFTVTDWDTTIYCPKPSKKERNAGLDGNNGHPTVKPVELMRQLIRLVTPPGGAVLDPFLGSGTTAVAATLEGFNWLGCELTNDYLPIIEKRIQWAETEVAAGRATNPQFKKPAADLG
jgi:DNA modification methylase